MSESISKLFASPIEKFPRVSWNSILNLIDYASDRLVNVGFAVPPAKARGYVARVNGKHNDL